MIRVFSSSKFILIFSIGTIFSQADLAYSNELESIRKKIFKDVDELFHTRFVVGLEVESSSTRRGATLHRYPHLEPSVHIHFINSKNEHSRSAERPMKPEIHLSFNSLSGGLLINDRLLLQVGFELSDSLKLLQLVKDDIRHEHARPLSIEIFTGLEYEAHSKLILGTQTNRDVSEHHGWYSSFLSRLKVLQWMDRDRALLDAWLNGMFGFGSKAHNVYLYGTGASAGISDFQIGGQLDMPTLIRDSSLGLTLDYTLLYGENRKAAFVRKKPDTLVVGLQFQHIF